MEGQRRTLLWQKQHVEDKNVLVVTASAGGIAPGMFHIVCTDNIKVVESYSTEGPLQFHVLWDPDKVCESGWLLGPNGRCYLFDSTARSQSGRRIELCSVKRTLGVNS